MKTMMFFLQRVWINEDGAAASEHAILLSLIVLVVIAASFFGGSVQKLYEDAAAKFPK